MEHVLKFALNCTKEAILILSKKSNLLILEFSNDSVASILRVSNNFKEIKDEIQNWNDFCSSVLVSQKVITPVKTLTKSVNFICIRNTPNF